MYRAPTGDASCAGHRASRPALWPSNSSPQRALVNRQGVADESVVRWRPGEPHRPQPCARVRRGGGQALANGDVQAGYGAAKPARDQGTDARGNGGGNCTRRTARVIHDVDAAPASSTPLRTCGPLGPTWIRTRDLGAMLPGDRPLVHTKRAQGKGEDEGEGEAEESERAGRRAMQRNELHRTPWGETAWPLRRRCARRSRRRSRGASFLLRRAPPLPPEKKTLRLLLGSG